MSEHDRPDAVAVVGMGCRFPGASGVSEFWRLLVDNRDAVTPVPGERFDIDAYYSGHGAVPGKTSSRFGGFLDDPFGFDACFFGIAPAEAIRMDPQQRLILTVAWEALEAAGILPSTLACSRTGVFIGQATCDYGQGVDTEALGIHEATGSRIRAMASGRLSYSLDLRGPSMLVDTACSSSLAAVHLARQSLLSGESTLALAGGVNVILSPDDAIAYSQAGMLSADGRCKFGDEQADGFVRSEGAGVVVLKRLHDALRDGDRVLALLLGSAVTNDGRGSGLLLQPAVSGQVEMLEKACASAGVSTADLDYVEAHGTGTPVGDDVELRALAATQASRPAQRGPLAIGSVKTNIGHTEAAAGIAGLIKAVLVAQHRVIPASLHLRAPAPLLAHGDAPLEVVTANRALDKAGSAGLIGVSSFGLSGTNAHVVVGALPPEPRLPAVPAPARLAGRPALLMLSARSAASLRATARAYARFLEPDGAGPRHALEDICAAAALRRDAHPYRLWATGMCHDDVAATLLALAEGRQTPNGGLGAPAIGGPKRTVFVFPGQGSQWAGMGRGLLASSPDFRRAMAACDEAVREEAGWSPQELLAETGSRTDGLPDRIDRIQPLLWAVQTALAETWRSLGVTPDVCLGHSMGEVAAAGVSGALPLRAAAAVICRRSKLMRRLAGRGAMLAVELSAEEALRAAAPYGDEVCLAVENSPRASVLAGDAAALRRVGEELAERGVFHQLVKVNVASHSAVMDTLRDDLLAALAPIRPRVAVTAMVSTVHCGPVSGDELDARYWMDNLRRPVRFAETVRLVEKDGSCAFLEISPHPVLRSAVEETLEDSRTGSVAVTSCRRNQDECAEITRAAGQLFVSGAQVDWGRWFAAPAPHVPLPHYAWDSEPTARPVRTRSADHVHDLPIDRDVTGVELHGLAPLPPALYLSSVFDAAHRAVGHRVFSLLDGRLDRSYVDPEHVVGLTVRLSPLPAGGHRAVVEARTLGPDGVATVPCLRARLVPDNAAGADQEGGQPLEAALARCRQYMSRADFHRAAAARGYRISEPFRSVDHVWRRGGEAVARLHLPAVPAAAAWETCFQPLIAVQPYSLSAYLPDSYGKVRLHGDLGDEFWSRVLFRAEDATHARAEVLVYDADGRLVAEFRGMRLRRLQVPGALGRGRPWTALPGAAAHAVTTVRRTSAGVLASLANRLAGAERPGPVEDTVLRPARAVPPRAQPAPVPAQAEPTVHPLLSLATGLLGISVERLDVRRPLRDYGLDSLLAAQLKGRLRTEFQVDMALGRLLGSESVEQLMASVVTTLER